MRICVVWSLVWAFAVSVGSVCLAQNGREPVFSPENPSSQNTNPNTISSGYSESYRNSQVSPTGSAPPAPGETFEQRLSRLEKAWEKNAAPSPKSNGPVSGKPTLKINGRIHLDNWSFSDSSPGIGFFENPITGDDPEDRTFFRRIRLKFEGDIYQNMLYRMQFDIHSPDDGEMKDVYIGFKDLPFFQTLLIGNQKRPIGLDHLNSSRFNVFIERPLVVEAFNEDARRLGIAAYGTSDDEVYNWRYGMFLLENMVDDGEIIGDSRQGSVNARLASSPWYECDGTHYFHWAVSGMVARPDGDNSLTERNRNNGRFRTRNELRSQSRWLNTFRIDGAEWYETLGLESILNVGPFQVVGEYQVNWMQRDNTTPGTGPDLFFHGAYVYVAYMLTGEHIPYNRKSGTIGRVKPNRNFLRIEKNNPGIGEGWGAWQVALRYSYLDLTDNDIRGGVGNDLTLGLVWYMNANASLQFNAVYGDIRKHRNVGGFTSGHFTALGTRLRINF
jgi:phosphate-selective porin OprO and OprP